MIEGRFYFLTKDYFTDFPDQFLMSSEDRPCFYAFEDNATGLFWMIPFSSRVAKYRGIYDSKIAKYKICDTLVFGQVLGYEKVFLIQNMCPVLPKYIQNEYIDRRTSTPVAIAGTLQHELTEKAKKVLSLHRHGIRLIFPDVLEIERKLLDMDQTSAKEAITV